MKRLLLALIRGYRTYISPSRPPCCRFIPTCSAYALEAVEKFLQGHILHTLYRTFSHIGCSME